MREIVSGKLWLGHARDARDLRQLHETGIGAVVDLAAEEEPCKLSRDLIYCRFPLIDGGDNDRTTLIVAIQQVVSLIRHGIPTLVACGAGMSRSPAVAAAALSIVEAMDADEVLSQITQESPHDITPWLWEQIRIVLGEMQST